MTHSYSFETPGLSLDQGIVKFFEDFYRISDTPGDHDNYVGQFADDATFIVAGKKNHGREEITKQRLAMWEHVEQRKHTVFKIFPFGNDSTEFMIYGLVNYQLKSGDKKDVEWAGRAQVVKLGGAWKLQFYQIWL